MRKVLAWGIPFLGLLAIVVFFSMFNIVQKDCMDMSEAIMKNSLSIMKKNVKEYEIIRYDSIVVDVKVEDKVNQYIIKKVYGMPGETILIKNNKLYINGKEVEEEYKLSDEFSKSANQEIKLGKNEYFILGNANNELLKARNEVYGQIDFTNIAGKIVYEF